MELDQSQRAAAGDARQPLYGSDLMVDLMRTVGIEYAALNPGATFRGLHDSLVNYGGNREPEIIQVCHEEISVAIAHGYAKAAGKPMAAIVHDVVGLQHAAMAIFNAWCDRVPILVLGGTGPMDAERRRPRIDWVHTALVQGNQVRDYVKWDDQPFSVAAVPRSFLRAWRLAVTEPQGPVYLCYDADIQEQRISEPVALPNLPAALRPPRLGGDPAAVEEAAALLAAAERPVILAGLSGRKPGALGALAQLAEALAAPVVDLGEQLSFPNTHPLDLTGDRVALLREADVVLALGAPDLDGVLRAPVDKATRRAEPLLPPGARVIHVSLAELRVRSWAADHQQLPAVDVTVAADTGLALPALVELVRRRLDQAAGGCGAREERRRALSERRAALRARWRAELERRWNERPISPARLAAEVWAALRGHDWVLADGDAKGWVRRVWDFERPGQYLGRSGGAGLGYGMGASLGAVLAHRGRDVVVVNLQPEGDFLFTPAALWTAAHHRLPVLTVMVDNRSYHNDEEHQEAIALVRGRPVENKVVGIRIDDPAVDFAALARSFGVYAEGPIADPKELAPALGRALAVVRDARRPALVDVLVAAT